MTGLYLIGIWFMLAQYFCVTLTACLYPQVETVTLMTTQWAVSCEMLSSMRLVQAPVRSEGWLLAGPSTPCSNKTPTEQEVITRDLLDAFERFLVYYNMHRLSKEMNQADLIHLDSNLSDECVRWCCITKQKLKTDLHVHVHLIPVGETW